MDPRKVNAESEGSFRRRQSRTVKNTSRPGPETNSLGLPGRGHTLRKSDLEDVYRILLKNAQMDGEHVRRWPGEFSSALGESLESIFDHISGEVRQLPTRNALLHPRLFF